MLRLAGQFIIILALFGAVAAFANWPIYRQTPNGTGIVILSLVHGADRRAECRRLSPAEVAKLPPNMRRVMECPRGRRAIYVELDIGGRHLYRANLPPTGIAGDGPSRIYERFVLPAGEYDIVVRMRDTPRTDGFDHLREGRITLAVDQMIAIDFNSHRGEFVFR
ncbi:MAG: hypothetical protein HY659_04355 [Rhizobiales bacterium]|nr:hypothetical protein [Hyphomicrobiales bacterium]